MATPATHDWVAFTDGACSGNPGPGGWAFVALRASPGEPFVWENCGAQAATTNNRMEMSALAELLELILKGTKIPGERPEHVRLEVLTDSTYLIQGLTSWVKNWKRRGWKRADGGEVSNRDVWERLDSLSSDPRLKLHLRYVRGHAQIPGNERADELSVMVSRKEEASPYTGPLSDYTGDAFEGFAQTGSDVVAWVASKASWFDELGEAKPKSKSKSSKGPALGYLSLVDGELAEHRDWKSCEARVKGRARARFRKYTSGDEKQSILKEWGV